MQKQFDSVLSDLLVEAGFYPEIVGLKGPEPALRLLVGVSGGVDSVCLLHFLLHSSVPMKIIVAHCNFHLRGKESDGDEAFVEDLCAEKGVEFCKADFDTLGHAQKKGLSMEIAARELRYEWFGRLCGERGCDAVVVAHNANDNAETLMLNLLRGTGLRGLCGMRPVSVVPIGEAVLREPEKFVPAIESALEPEIETGDRNRKTPLLRPLLGFTRRQIEDYARANNIHWREDSTNKESATHRNILRNEVFPIFAEINPSFIRTINREMQYFTDADDLVESVVPDLIRKGKIDIEELLSHDSWRLFLFNLLRPYNFNSAVIDDIAEHLIHDLENHIFYSPTHRLQITSRNLIISVRAETITPDTYIYEPGTYELFGRIIKIELLARGEVTDLKAPSGTTYLDADKVRFPFMLRGWRHGDWFRPLGMGGATKKVSDLFVDLKYSVRDKETALFLHLPYDAKSHISALLGERIDDGVKVDSATKKILRITISPLS